VDVVGDSSSDPGFINLGGLFAINASFEQSLSAVLRCRSMGVPAKQYSMNFNVYF